MRQQAPEVDLLRRRVRHLERQNKRLRAELTALGQALVNVGLNVVLKYQKPK